MTELLRQQSHISQMHMVMKWLWATREGADSLLTTRFTFTNVEMREHNGKLFEASNKLIRAEVSYFVNHMQGPFMSIWLICCIQKALYMPDFEGQNFKKEKIHTTDMLHGKISLMSFVLAQYAEVSHFTVN